LTATDGYIDFLKDQLAGLGAVTVRRMFGGAGVYCGGVMFGLIADDTLYLKADEKSRADFEAESLEPFTYQAKGGRSTVMSYWRAPERLYDEPEEMLAWASKALATAQRASRPKRRARQANRRP
jgi:DNA transformation protein